HTGPGRFLAGGDVQSVLAAETLGGGDHHRGAVGERNEADAQVGLFRRIRAGGPGGAAQEGRCRQAQAGHGDGLLEKGTTGRITLVHGGTSFSGNKKRRHAGRPAKGGKATRRTPLSAIRGPPPLACCEVQPERSKGLAKCFASNKNL